MAKNILKEAIADAKAVREVALANAKAALEEAFTPRLQSMLSAKLSEELEEETLEETEGMEPKEDMDEIMEPMREEEEEVKESFIDEGGDEELDEEVDLEEILAELELEESEIAEVKKDDDLDEAKKDDDLDEAKDKEEVEEATEIGNAQPKHTNVKNAYKNPMTDVMEGKEFDLDALLEEINSLDEDEGPKPEDDEMEEPKKDDVEEGFSNRSFGSTASFDKAADPSKYDNMKYPDAFKDGKIDPQWDSYEDLYDHLIKYYMGKAALKFPDQWETMDDGAKKTYAEKEANRMHSRQLPFWKEKMAAGVEAGAEAMAEVQKELEETKAALGVKTSQLNEVNLLNSKLLYVNRIFKANTLDDAQKLRVVESLDKAECVKEAKLIYETIKDSFNIVGKTKKKKTIKEGFGMASKAAGTSTAPKREVISESNNMVARFQKLANIQINE